MNLTKYEIPLGSLPLKAEQVIKQKTIESEFLNFQYSPQILDTNLEDGIYKNKNNSYFIQCTTNMRGVVPQMIDWWFIWHLPSSERYRLWHPRDHLSARLNSDISQEDISKKKYIGLNSYVEEYIGKKLYKLCITFEEPEGFGFKDLDHDFTAVCASVTDTLTGVNIAKLVHYVKKEGNDSIMKSLFWMGVNLSHSNALKNFFVKMLSQIRPLKKILLNDRAAKDLLIHCYEEMNHLPKFLPSIYEDMTIQKGR